jgi:hypothetical protein
MHRTRRQFLAAGSAALFASRGMNLAAASAGAP